MSVDIPNTDNVPYRTTVVALELLESEVWNGAVVVVHVRRPMDDQPTEHVATVAMYGYRNDDSRDCDSARTLCVSYDECDEWTYYPRFFSKKFLRHMLNRIKTYQGPIA
jgi:hypothetical protein